MIDLTRAAHELAEALNESLDGGTPFGYLEVLDALATAGLTLEVDEDRAASRAYLEAVELEGILR